jgi:hypothetical protein
MPDTSQPGGSPGGGGIGANLKAKLGPMPVWVWLALITALLLGYWLLTKNKSGASSGSSGTQQGTPADVGQPGVVVINQDQPGTEPPETELPDKKPHHPPREPQTRQITLDRNETLGQLAKQRHWSADTLKDVEELNVLQGGGEMTAKTKLKKGQTIVRPIKSP